MMQPMNEVAPKGPGRPRVLPSMCLWAGMLVCVLRGMGSQLELWRLLSSKGLWEYPRFEITDPRQSTTGSPARARTPWRDSSGR